MIPAAGSNAAQAHRALDELLRLKELDSGWDWTRAAVVARQWDTLEIMRAVCRERDVETQLAQEDFTAYVAAQGDPGTAGMDRRPRTGRSRPRRRWIA